MESRDRKQQTNLLRLAKPSLAGLVLYFVLAGPLWAPPSPGWCKNNTFLSPIANLSFGAFASNAGGQVIVSVTGIRTATAGISLLGGTVGQAAFDIIGCPNSVYSIITPPDSTLVFGVDTMTLTTFTTYPVGSGILDANGAGIIQFGATLVVNAPQPAGSYTGTYTVEIVIQ